MGEHRIGPGRQEWGIEHECAYRPARRSDRDGYCQSRRAPKADHVPCWYFEGTPYVVDVESALIDAVRADIPTPAHQAVPTFAHGLGKEFHGLWVVSVEAQRFSIG